MPGPDLVAVASAVADDLEAHGARRCLALDGASAAYVGDEAGGAWVEAFLAGHLTRGDAPAGFTVVGTSDPRLADAVRGLGTDPAPPDHDAVVVRSTSKAVPGEDVVRVLLPRQHRLLVLTSGHPVVDREEGMQSVRAVVRWQLMERGWLPMHAAVVARGDLVVCVAGGKASGKTSTLLTLLGPGGCDLVAVDKFLVREDGSGVEVLGLPGKAGIRVGTAVGQQAVMGWLRGAEPSFFPHPPAEEVEEVARTHTAEQLRHRPEKLNLLPTELAALYGRVVRPAGRLALVLVPVYDPAATRSRLEPLATPDAAAAVAACYGGVASKGEGYLQHVAPLDDDDLRTSLEATLRRRLPGVPAFELHQGHRTNAHSAELVDAALRA